MIDFIRGQLAQEELLAQLAEEAAELSQAALKLRRVLDGKNPTPVTYGDALEDLREEIADVTLCITVLGLDEIMDTHDRMMSKMFRWSDRLKDAQKKEVEHDGISVH